MNVVIFEGNQWRQFAPLTLSRPSFQLCCGIGTLLDKQIRATKPTKLNLWVRTGLEGYCRQHILPRMSCPTQINAPLDDEPTLLLSGRTLHLTGYEHADSPSVVTDQTAGGEIVRQAFVHDPGLSPSDLFDRTDRWLKLLDLPRSMPQSRLPEYIWDLISWNEEAIVADSIAHKAASQPFPAGPFHLVEASNIWFGTDVKLQPGCVIDASRGPVTLCDHVSIGANSVVMGPCYIGSNTQVSPLSVIKHGVSIGPMCKVGGEISNSVILGYSNKPHDGYLGDSYIGEWVNLGSGTTTSNLKNTYSQVSMSLGGEPIATGRRFLGSMIGDHTKVAVGTLLMTGSYVGYNSMIATSKYPPKFVPSYVFLTDEGAQPYRMEKAEMAMKEVFNRRQREWTTTDEQMNQFAAENARLVEGWQTGG